MIRIALAGMIFAAAAVSAAATPPSCIDPSRSFIARPLSEHQVYVESTIGPKKPPIRVSTSCIHLSPAVGFGFSGDFHCISLGDTVVANLISERQGCVVTKVEAYVPQQGDIPDKNAKAAPLKADSSSGTR
jgi:hypothetical protein